MSDYTRWQLLNESLGFPLGISTPSILPGFTALEEAKKGKKKMDVDVDDDEDEEEDEEENEPEEEDEEDSDKELVVDKDEKEKEDKPEGCCSCEKPELAPGGLMCKKCKKNCSKKQKKMKNENIFAPYEKVSFEPMPEIGSEEYRQSFWKSLNGHFDDPRKKFASGVKLGEEVLIAPTADETPVEPQAGEPGYAPMTRIGSFASQAPAKADWEQQWNQLGEQFIQKLSAKIKK